MVVKKFIVSIEGPSEWSLESFQDLKEISITGIAMVARKHFDIDNKIPNIISLYLPGYLKVKAEVIPVLSGFWFKKINCSLEDALVNIYINI